MSQLSIFDFEAPLARVTDPITSHQAAASARELQARHGRLIVETLRGHGPAGVDRIAALTRLTSYQISKRMVELHRVRAIRLTGRLVRSTSGRNEREWEAA